jgi:hypothetical protein
MSLVVIFLFLTDVREKRGGTPLPFSKEGILNLMAVTFGVGMPSLKLQHRLTTSHHRSGAIHIPTRERTRKDYSSWQLNKITIITNCFIDK